MNTRERAELKSLLAYIAYEQSISDSIHNWYFDEKTDLCASVQAILFEEYNWVLLLVTFMQWARGEEQTGRGYAYGYRAAHWKLLEEFK